MSDTFINDIFDFSSRFLRSTQLERDFHDPLALEGYVVTTETETHLKRIGKGMQPKSGLRSWRITGDYGSGKSSFALLLANLVGRPKKDLPKHVRPLVDVLAIPRGSKPYLPVLVTGSRESLSLAVARAFIGAVKSNSNRRKFSELEQLKKLIDSPKKATDADILNTMVSVSDHLVDREEFSGSLIILDELGKFLEFAAVNPEQQDVFFLQQLGEISARSGSSPIVTIGLLHQGFGAYANQLSDTAQREWEKIGGRYESLTFSQPLSQVATLISSALQVDLKKLPRGWESKAQSSMDSAIEMGMFGGSRGKTALKAIAPTLYPLHPTILPVLNRFFRRFGQNERSLFSFLLSSEPYALPDFAHKKANCENIYRLSDFYDFAAENFAHRLSAQSFRSHWNHIEAIVQAYPDRDSTALRVLKTIAVLNILEVDELSPTKDVLALCLDETDGLDEVLDHLTYKTGVIFNRGTTRGYSLWPNTSVNLEQAMCEAAERVTSLPPMADVARQRLEKRPIVARKHYIETGTLRHFSVEYLTAQEFTHNIKNLSPEHLADGLLAVVLCEKQDECLQVSKVIQKGDLNSEVIVAVSPPLGGLIGHAKDLEQWHWVQNNIGELKDDRFASEEVARQISTISKLIENWLQVHLNIQGLPQGLGEQRGIKWFHNGKPAKALNAGGSLQSFLSSLCSDELFPDAPRIHNELINRHAISSAAAGARQKLFGLMLKNGDRESLGFPPDKAPPAKSMYLSVLKAGNIHRKEKKEWIIAAPNQEKDHCNLRPALDAIRDKLEEQSDARVKVSDIYILLRAKPFGVRDGLIPILLLVVLLEYESEIAVYEDGQFVPDIEEFAIMRLVKAPETFEFQLCRITGVRRKIIQQLAEVVNGGKAEKGDLLSIVRPLCLFVAGLPEYARNTDNLTDSTLALRKAVQKAQEPANLVFKSIPSALGFKNGKIEPNQLATELASSLSELRRCFPELQSRLSQAILKCFGSDANLEEWRAETSGKAELVLQHLADAELRSFCLKLHDDILPEKEWLESLGSLLTRRPPSRWGDRDEETFNEAIKLYSARFLRVLSTCFDQDASLPSESIRLAITKRDGSEQDIVLSLDKQKQKEIDLLKKQLRQNIPKDSNTAIVALSQIMWDLLKSKS